MTDNFNDAVHITRVLDGDTEAFRELVARYNGLIYRIAYSMVGNEEEARDAAQEVFYRAFRALKSYNPTWPFGAWLRRITVNYMLDQRKKKKVQTVSITMDETVELDVPDSAMNPREKRRQSEQNRSVWEAMNQLPDKYRMILSLRHFENLSYEEISETLSLPLGTVMTNIHRARKKLAEMLQPIQSELLS
ncbi:MAG: sigma-70 family RNA polymerase sigma factor [Candidatus Omnitrophota bacterium]|jgi:RNA polymerase sigma-70 factor (ECF subfamily)|nr:MAG: sigma-70 family RNA polymerase sigma factor [Candidatus Omnitrophota bacterium]